MSFVELKRDEETICYFLNDEEPMDSDVVDPACRRRIIIIPFTPKNESDVIKS